MLFITKSAKSNDLDSLTKSAAASTNWPKSNESRRPIKKKIMIHIIILSDVLVLKTFVTQANTHNNIVI